MADQVFRISVLVDPAGARPGIQSVDRELKKVEGTALNVEKLLKRVLTVAFILKGIQELQKLADTYTSLQNRIRVVVQSNELLGTVTQKVFDIAQRSRSSFEATAELFSRAALATRDLGTSEAELLGITESVNKAIILSGASAKEANNGLIQLSQGIASNRLGGDELRAVLEQLPVVADVIAKQLGLTRGQLRIFSREGNISAKVVLDAFKNAREEIETRFAKTIPTIGQALQLLQNNLIKTFGELTTSSGAATAAAQAIAFFARNIETLIRLLLIVGATASAFSLAPFIKSALDSAKAARELQTVLGESQALVIREAAAEEVAAAARVQKTQATIAAVRAEGSLALVTFESTAAGRAQAVADVQAAAASLRRAEAAEASAAAIAQKAAAEVFDAEASSSSLALIAAQNAANAELITARATLVTSTEALAASQLALNASVEAGTVAESVTAANEARISALRGQLAAETGVLSLTQSRLNTAVVAGSASTGIFTLALAKARAAVASLWAVIAANPLGAALIAVAALGTALFVFRNDILVSGDGFATLGDLTSSYFDLFKGGLQSIKNSFGEVFGFIGDLINRVFGQGSASLAGFLRGVARAADFLLGFSQGPLLAVFTFITGLPAALGDLGTTAINGILKFVQQFVALFRAAFNTVLNQASRFFDGLLGAFRGVGEAFSKALEGDFAGAADAASAALSSAFSGVKDSFTGIPEAFQKELDAALNGGVFQLENQFTGEAEALGVSIAQNFVAGFESTATLDFVNDLIADAEEKAKERREAALRAEGQLNTKGIGASTINPAVVKITRELQDQEALLSLVNKTNSERKIESDLLRIKNELITQGAAQASQQLGQVDQQIAQLRQKQTAEDADTRAISIQISKLQTLRQSVIDRTTADRGEFDAILDGLRIQLLANDALQAQAELIDDLRGKQEQSQRRLDAANDAFDRGAISATEYAKALRIVAEESRNPFEQATHELELQNAILSITRDTNAERETAVALAQQLQALAAQGEALAPSQEAKLGRLIAENQALERQADLVGNIPLTQSKADELLIQMISDLDAAYARGAISIEQYSIALEQANQATLTAVAQTERDLQQQNELLRVTGITNEERQFTISLLQIEQGLRNQGISLSASERERLTRLLQENAALERQQQLIESITPVASKVQQQYRQDLIDVSAAFQRGAIDGQQYAQALEDIRLKAAEAGHTMEDGLVRASIKIQNSILDMATVTEQSLVSAFNSAESALNEFVTKGTLDVRQFALSLLADFENIAAHALILEASQGLGFVKEKPGTGFEAGAAALDPAAAALTAGATALAPAALSLNTGAVGLGTGSAVLQTAATTLATVVPGLTAAAIQLQAAAAALAAANAAGGSGLGAGLGAGLGGNGSPFEFEYAASGADARANQPFIVGERGFELFVPQTAGTIIPHRETVAALAGASNGQGGQTTVNVPAPQVHLSIENRLDAKEIVSSGLDHRDNHAKVVNVIGKNKTSVRKELA